MFPVSLLRIPYSLTVAVFWSLIVYYPVGLAPDPATCAACHTTLSLRQIAWQCPTSQFPGAEVLAGLGVLSLSRIGICVRHFLFWDDAAVCIWVRQQCCV